MTVAHAAERGGQLMAALRHEDLGGGVCEVTRVRQMGSRTCLFCSVPATLGVDARATPGLSPVRSGEYRLTVTPGQYVPRNLRVTPLSVPPGPALAALELPEVPIFFSDYSLFEGSGDPDRHYTDTRAPVADQVRRACLGDNLAGCFERMGDPLTVPRSIQVPQEVPA
jgi:hypothetical protein